MKVMTKLMMTTQHDVTVDRNDEHELEMSNSVKVTLTSCFHLVNQVIV